MKSRPTAWWQDEEQLRLSALPAMLPPNSDGRRVSLASCYRWAQSGVRGIKLRTFRIGGRFCTTRQELDRWSAALTEAAQ